MKKYEYPHEKKNTINITNIKKISDNFVHYQIKASNKLH